MTSDVVGERGSRLMAYSLIFFIIYKNENYSCKKDKQDGSGGSEDAEEP